MSSKCLPIESEAVRLAEQARRAILNLRTITSAGQLGSVARANGNPTMRVGFIGFDPIGEAMASRLLRAGHQLRMYDPARDIPEALETAGGSVANSIQDACRWADAIFTMLPNDEAAEEVILGPGGVVECLSGKAIHIGSSAVSVDCCDRIVEAHWNAGKQYISAPVLVRPESTAEVQLIVIAGGREATIFQIEPLLSPIGQLAQVSDWPSDANLVQLDAKCLGENLFQSLAQHLELRARQDRSQIAGRAFPDLKSNLDMETKGILK